MGFVAAQDLRAWDACLADASPVPEWNDQALPAARELALGSGAALVALDLALRYHANRGARPIAWRRRRLD
jgi:hypothetical protein